MNSHEEKQLENIRYALEAWNNENQPLPKISHAIKGSIIVNETTYIAVSDNNKTDIYLK